MPINYNVDYPKLQNRCWDAEADRDRLRAELQNCRNKLKASGRAKLREENERLRAERDALKADAERYQWLTDDHAGSVREQRNTLLDRMAVMSKSATDAFIDAAPKEKP